MNVSRTELPGVLMLEPRLFGDERGFLYEAFNAERFAEYETEGLPTAFRQTNHSRSTVGVLRGLHYQLHRPQGKLVTCVHGAIFDVAVDIRVGSPNFGRWTSAVLDDKRPRYLWIPPGFAHGFCALSPVADVLYECTDVYVADDEHGVLWSDPSIGVRWPVADLIISLKDRENPPLDPNRADLPTFVP